MTRIGFRREIKGAMRTFISASAAIGVLVGQSLTAQGQPNFSGRWVLLESRTTLTSGVPTPTINAAEELIVDHSATVLRVEHPSQPGTHPKAETHRFVSQGTLVRGGGEFRSDVFWFGRQVVIGTTRTEAAGTGEVRQTSESSEMWSLETDGTLVIDVTERRPGAVAKIRLVYGKR